MTHDDLIKQYFMKPDTVDTAAESKRIEDLFYHEMITDINYVPKTLEEAKQHPLWVDGHIKVVIWLLGFVVLIHLFAAALCFNMYEFNKVSVYIALFFAGIFWLYYGNRKLKNMWLNVVIASCVSGLVQMFLPYFFIRFFPELIQENAYELFMSNIWGAYIMVAGSIWLALWTLGILLFYKKYKVNYKFNL